jgi:hypothetical protein
MRRRCAPGVAVRSFSSSSSLFGFCAFIVLLLLPCFLSTQFSVIFSDVTYLAPHGTPSGGDWAVHRGAALFFEGTKDILLDSCVFWNLVLHLCCVVSPDRW